jgi:hypothetical protein
VRGICWGINGLLHLFTAAIGLSLLVLMSAVAACPAARESPSRCDRTHSQPGSFLEGLLLMYKPPLMPR